MYDYCANNLGPESFTIYLGTYFGPENGGRDRGWFLHRNALGDPIELTPNELVGKTFKLVGTEHATAVDDKKIWSLPAGATVLVQSTTEQVMECCCYSNIYAVVRADAPAGPNFTDAMIPLPPEGPRDSDALAELDEWQCP
jgi:hypothetical protein